MGRQRTAAQIDRQAKLALARENHYKNKPASTLTTVRKRAIRKFVYNSYSLTNGAGASQLLSVPGSDAAINYMTAGTDADILAKLGLKKPAAVTDPVIETPRGFHPAKVSIMVGTATPTASVSPWGTRVIKYSTATAGTAQAHYSAPICSDTTSTYNEVDAKATALYTALITGSKLGELDYARFYLLPEKFTNSKN